VNKQALVVEVARRLGTSRAKAAELVDLFFASDGIIAAELRKGGAIKVTGFGAFMNRKRAPRTGRNPRTGKEIRIGASIVPTFRAGQALKDQVNRSRR
jgi:DNA-binding protein HU-beta